MQKQPIYVLRCFYLERNVETQVHTCVRAERNELLAHLAKDMIHTDEHVEALRMHVENPSAACCVAVQGEVYAAVNPLQRRYIGAQTTLRPCVLAIEACRAEQTELELAIEREGVFGANVERSADAGCAAPLVAFVSKVGEVGKLVAVLVALTLERVVLKIAVSVVLVV